MRNFKLQEDVFVSVWCCLHTDSTTNRYIRHSGKKMLWTKSFMSQLIMIRSGTWHNCAIRKKTQISETNDILIYKVRLRACVRLCVCVPARACVCVCVRERVRDREREREREREKERGREGERERKKERGCDGHRSRKEQTHQNNCRICSWRKL